MRRIYSESELRALPVCIGCGKPKDQSLVVCWHCFKYEETRFTPLKYWGQSTESWQQHLVDCGIPVYTNQAPAPAPRSIGMSTDDFWSHYDAMIATTLENNVKTALAKLQKI